MRKRAALRLCAARPGYATFGAPPPLLEARFVKIVGKARGANEKRSARMIEFVIARSEATKQSRQPRRHRKPAWIASLRSQ